MPTYKVEMGGVRKPQQFKKCPWSVALADRNVTLSLRAYGALERWKEWPPGRRDPRLMEALSVIATEHNRIDQEKYNPTP